MFRQLHTQVSRVKNLAPTLTFNSTISPIIQREIDLILNNPIRN